MKNNLMSLAKSGFFKRNLHVPMARSMNTFALPVSSQVNLKEAELNIADQHAIQLSQHDINRLHDGGNIFPHRQDTYLVFTSTVNPEEVDGLDNVVYWRESRIPVNLIGTTADGEVTLFANTPPTP